VLARVMYLHLWDWEGAEREFRLGMGLEPTDASNSWGIAGYANFLTAMGRFDEAIEVARRAIEIEPLAFWAHGEAGFAQVMAGRPEESLTTLREATELLSSSAELNFILLIANAEAGNMKKAEELLPPVEIIRQVSSPATIGFMGNYYARLGHQAEARELLAHLLAQTSERYVSEPLIALIHIGLGEHEEAVLALERGCREDHDPLCVWLKEHYMYDDLRSDPRFQALVDSMHFPVA